MKHIRTAVKRGFFKILVSSRAIQTTAMVLQPGQSTGEPQNEHPHSEQWLFVVSGSGRALVNTYWPDRAPTTEAVTTP